MHQFTEFDLDTLIPLVKEALECFTAPDDGTSSLASLFLLRLARREPHRNLRQLTNRVLHRAWSELQNVAAEDARFIQMRFFDGETMVSTALGMNISEGHAYKIRNRSIERLARIVLRLEQVARAEQQRLWTQRLAAPTYVDLFGVERHIEDLLPILYRKEPPWIVVLEGIGGIGKTTLAHALMQQVIASCVVDDLAWVSFKPSQLLPTGDVVVTGNETAMESLLRTLVLQLAPDVPVSAQMRQEQMVDILRARLKERVQIVVVDNLESAADLQLLMPLIEELSNPSRFLLTSRTQVASMHPVYRFLVPALSRIDAGLLVQKEAEWGNLHDGMELTEEELDTIYAVVGGNPLALRLVVGLTRSLSLQEVLLMLQEAATHPITLLYRYIFEQAWELLDEAAQNVFVYMPLVARRGDPFEVIRDGCGMDQQPLQDALALLVKLNLVDVIRNGSEYRYGIHSLTRTFLLNDAIEW